MTVRWTVRAADRVARRQLSAQLTEGEKMLDLLPYFKQNGNFFLSLRPFGARQIVKQVQHFLIKLRLVFSSQDTSWDDC